MSYRSPHPLRGRRLRRTPTDAERRIWGRLRAGQIGGARFRRQEPVGPYVVDFCCLPHKLIVEVDGGQHAEQVEDDARRTEFLQRRGYRVLRFWNDEVLRETDSVIERIAQALGVLETSGVPGNEREPK
jgi:very-short-patch-repair endonuclease